MAAPQLVFAELEKKFSWDPKIAEWLLADDGLGAKSVDDFLHMAASEQGNEFEAVVKAAGCSNTGRRCLAIRLRCHFRQSPGHSDLWHHSRSIT